RGRVKRYAVNLFRVLGGEQKAQHGTGREAADNDAVARGAEFQQGLLGAPVPVLPSGGLEIGLAAAVAGQLRAKHRHSEPSQAIGDEAKLGRRAAQSVDQKDTRAAPVDTIAPVIHPHGTSLLAEIDKADSRGARKVPLFLELHGWTVAAQARPTCPFPWGPRG